MGDSMGLLHIVVYHIPRKSNLERLIPRYNTNSSATSVYGTTLSPSTFASAVQCASFTPTVPPPSTATEGLAPSVSQILLGKVEIHLQASKRGAQAIGYYPIIPDPSTRMSQGGVTYGDLKLSLHVDE
jgi:hypothetical protein